MKLKLGGSKLLELLLIFCFKGIGADEFLVQKHVLQEKLKAHRIVGFHYFFFI